MRSGDARVEEVDMADVAVPGLEQVAATDATVLIVGERGAGHAAVARALHRLSARRDRPFEAVTAALPSATLDAELFGQDRHGRRVTPGKVVLANTGTLFLDEITEFGPALQGKLLQILQERTVTRLGAPQGIAVDVRVIAGTHRDMRAAMERGRFRADLYYRLNVLRVYLRPLRQRRDEIPHLVRRLVEKYAARYRRPFRDLSAHAMRRLVEHAWPGNLSELENVVERLVVLDSEEWLDTELGAPPALRARDVNAAGSPGSPAP